MSVKNAPELTGYYYLPTPTMSVLLFHLRKLWSVKQSLTPEVTKTLQ